MIVVSKSVSSTYTSRYKDKINQTVVETFADEIRAHNFSYSQLEIDDGYEKEYGDFSFDSSKFPDARSMVNSLHKKVNETMRYFYFRSGVAFREPLAETG